MPELPIGADHAVHGLAKLEQDTEIGDSLGHIVRVLAGPGGRGVLQNRSGIVGLRALVSQLEALEECSPILVQGTRIALVLRVELVDICRIGAGSINSHRRSPIKQ